MTAYLLVRLINGEENHYAFKKESCKDLSTSMGDKEEGLFYCHILPMIEKPTSLLRISDIYFETGHKKEICIPARNVLSVWMEWI